MTDNPTPAVHSRSLTASSCIMYLFGLILLFYSIVLRIEPSIGHPILQSLKISPDAIVPALANYQFPMILAFIAAGFLIDILGPRFWLFIGLILTIVGNYFFSDAASMQDILVSRILIGFSHPIIFLSILKLGADWIPKNHFGLFVGFFFSVLLLTPQFIQPLFIFANKTYGWDMVVNGITFLGVFLLLTLIATCFLKSSAPGFKSMNLSGLLKNSKVWLLCIISTLAWIANTFMLNWGAVILNHGLHFPPSLALSSVQEMFLFFSLGGIFFGLFSDVTRCPRLFLFSGLILAGAAFATLMVRPDLSLMTLGNLVLFIGFVSGSAITCYLLAFDFFGAATSASAFGLIAFATTMGNTWFAQLTSGVMIPIVKGPLNMDFNAYMYVLAAIPSALFLGALLTLTLGRTRQILPD